MRRFPEEPSAHVVVTSVPKLSRAVGIPQSTLTNWKNVYGWRFQRKDGRYCSRMLWREIERARQAEFPEDYDGENEGEQANGSSGVNDRLALARARKLELEYEKLRGELISRRLVEQRIMENNSVVTRALIGLASELPPLLEDRSAGEMEAIIKKKVREALENLANPETFGQNG